MMQYSLFQQSIQGTRSSNQDRIGYLEKDNSAVLVLADGLGGYSRGELAAETLVETVINSYESVKQRIIVDPSAFIVLTVMHAHSLINRRARQEGIEVSLPRTTGVICLVQNGFAYWGHVGDSRLYHLSDAKVLSRTMDHSTSEQMHQDGIISEEDMSRSDMQGQLVRCIGGPQRPVVTMSPETRLQQDECLLLCSDGVWRAFPGDRIATFFDEADVEEATDNLLAKAERLQKRDCDNLSVVAFRWEQEATTRAPLYPHGQTEIDQSKLWRQALRKAKIKRIEDNLSKSKKKALKETGHRQEDFDSTIEELENFVNEIEKIF